MTLVLVVFFDSFIPLSAYVPLNVRFRTASKEHFVIPDLFLASTLETEASNIARLLFLRQDLDCLGYLQSAVIFSMSAKHTNRQGNRGLCFGATLKEISNRDIYDTAGGAHAKKVHRVSKKNNRNSMNSSGWSFEGELINSHIQLRQRELWFSRPSYAVVNNRPIHNILYFI